MRIRADRGTETVNLFAAHRAFHWESVGGNMEYSWKYGKSIHNQKIECFWSQMLVQWLNRWRGIFQKFESNDLWNYGDEVDQIALLYVYMPILREEISMYRQEYNAYPIRSNLFSRLPSGPPMDNYVLDDIAPRYSIPITNDWTRLVQREMLPDFDADEYLSATTQQELSLLMERSPLGPLIDVHNAEGQYLYLRMSLHSLCADE